LLAGDIGSAVVVVGFKLGEPRVGSGAASHSFAVVLHEAVRRPRLSRGREATQFVDRTGGRVMALPGLHEVLVAWLMPRAP
jgi:hypothetical protein